jgi:hypothetical protein
MSTAIWIALVFLAANVLVPLAVYLLSRKHPTSKGGDGPVLTHAKEHPLEAQELLAWEFEYARTTASEAMDQRHTMVNFYLLVTGFVITGVTAVLSLDPPLPPYVATALLWLLCCIGWIHYLSIIRLRQAWHDSAQVMNEIKLFYVQHAELDPNELYGAFLWKSHTMPKAGKLWTVHFYSAMLIALLDSLAYVAGIGLWACTPNGCAIGPTIALLGSLFLMLFGFHYLLYRLFFKE